MSAPSFKVQIRSGIVPQPLLVYDGDCTFCKMWIERWRQITGDAVDYAPFQTAGADFPEIPREAFAEAVKLIEPDGRVTSGAEAVFRSLAHGNRHAGLRLYQEFASFA